VKKGVTVQFLFAVMQGITAVAMIILAISLQFNFFNSQTALNAPQDAISFYVVVLAIFGFVFLTSGLFLIYEWWESM
jgi:ABC-type nickel/cobalt efflux system permease component RcnA